MDEIGKNNLTDVPQDKESHGENKRKHFWRIDLDMLPYKLQYFLYNGSLGAFWPSIPIIATHGYGLTASNLAVVFALPSFLCILFTPAAGHFVDYFNKLKATIIGLAVIQIMFCFLMVITPQIYPMHTERANQNILSRDKLSQCFFCNHHQEFAKISSIKQLQSFEEVLHNKSLHCIETFSNNTGHNVKFIQQQEKIFWFHSYDFIYKLVHRAYNNTFGDEITLYKNTTRSNENMNDMNFTALSLPLWNDSQINRIICSHPIDYESSLKYKYVNLSLLVDHSYSVTDKEYLSQEILCKIYSLPTRNISCVIILITDMPHTKYEKDATLSVKKFLTYRFWLFTLYILIFAICQSTILNLADLIACSESVRKAGADFGHQRVWGPIGGGLFALLAGYLNNFFNCYTPTWALQTILCLLMIWNLSKMDLSKPDFSKNSRKDLKIVLSSARFLTFEVGVFFCGMYSAITFGYVPWFVTSIGGNDFVNGLTQNIRNFGLVPFMIFSGWFIKKLGCFNLVSLALFGYSVRFLLYSHIHNPWLIIPVECLEGITYGSFLPAMATFAKLNSKPGTEATTLSVLYTFHGGIGHGLGSLFAGICFDKFGSHTTFFYAFLFCVSTSVSSVIYTIWPSRRKGKLDITEMKTTHQEHG